MLEVFHKGNIPNDAPLSLSSNIKGKEPTNFFILQQNTNPRLVPY
jgi:hypothetical protein